MTPSRDRMDSPSMKRLDGVRYVLIMIGARRGKILWIFCRAAWRLIELNALEASTNKIASQSSDSKTLVNV